MWFYRQEPINIGYHPAKFGGHKHCGSEDVVVLVCHVISQDHVIKSEMWHFRQQPIKVGYNLTKFSDQRHCGSEDILIFICYKIL